MQPISTVEGDAFKKLIHALDTRYALPSRHHFSRVVLPNMYLKCREQVSNVVSKAKGVSLFLEVVGTITISLSVV